MNEAFDLEVDEGADRGGFEAFAGEAGVAIARHGFGIPPECEFIELLF